MNVRKMKIIYGIFIFVNTIFCIFGAQNSKNTKLSPDICSVCFCNPREKYINCANQQLPNQFLVNDWITVNSSSNQPALDHVEFDSNGIEEVTQFPDLDIRILSLKNNKISKIEVAAFHNLTLLEILDLSSNRLTFESLHMNVFQGQYNAYVYEPLKNLKWLSLANNDIHTLHDDLFDHLNALETLKLCHNPFKIINHNSQIAISSLPNLKTLDMGSMELTDLPEHIFHAPNKLRNLSLSGNLFKKLPEALMHARNLKELNFDDNLVQHFGSNKSIFPSLPKLETLSMSYMPKLETIGNGTFHNLPALLHFRCSYNPHLSELNKNAFSMGDKDSKWPDLQTFIINNNKLSTIDEQLILKWDTIQEIDIRYNPWKCECNNQWMIDTLLPYIKEKSKEMPALSEIMCDSPIEMHGLSFAEIHDKKYHMRCEDYYGRRPERDGPVLVGIFIGLVIGIPIAMAILLIYRRGCFGIFGYRPSPNDFGRAFYKRAGLSEDMYI